MLTTSTDMPSEYGHLWDSEQVILCRDDSVGLRAVIAIDNTVRGPGFGGVRMRNYATERAGIVEAQRLASAMTLKNAVAALPYGGAKSVIFVNSPPGDRIALMRRFGEFVRRTAGMYMPGVDMGTTIGDLREVGASGAVVACSELDPSPWTADGVLAAMCGAAHVVYGDASLMGTSVVVQGVGHVGSSLAKSLTALGADVGVSDVDEARARAVAEHLGAKVIPAHEALTVDCDVFAPCAAAGILTEATVRGLRCKVVVGAANDPLSDDAVAQQLTDRGITYVPDFVSSAGGVIQVHADRSGWDEATLRDAIQQIGGRVRTLLTDADRRGVTSLEAAYSMARQALAPSA